MVRKGEFIKMRADSRLISLSIMAFLAAMLIEGLLFLPINTLVKAQAETFSAYVFGTSLVMLAIVGVASVFKRKF
jgi:hypothetical protein